MTGFTDKHLSIFFFVGLGLSWATLIFFVLQGIPNPLITAIGGPRANFCPEGGITLWGHCFPDYGTFFELPSDNPWDWAFPHSHPPLAQLVQSFFAFTLQEAGIDYFSAIGIWSVINFGSAVISALIIFKGLFRLNGKLVLLAFLLTANFGLLNNLWAGNSTALVLPFISLSVVGLLRRRKMVWIWLGLSIALRPQLILLLLFLLFRSEYFQILRSLVFGTLLSSLALLFFPSPALTLLQSWTNNILSYPLYASPFMYSPENLGIGRTIVKFFELFYNNLVTHIYSNDSATFLTGISEPLRFVSNNRTVLLLPITLVLALLVIYYKPLISKLESSLNDIEKILCLLIAAIVLPSTSFHYYLLFLLPVYSILVAQVLGSAKKTDFIQPDTNRFLFLGLLLCFSLWYVPVSLFRADFGSTPNLIGEVTGPILFCILAGLITSALFYRQKNSGLSKPR